MPNPIKGIKPLNADPPEAAIEPEQVLAAWRLGRRLNELRWFVGQAWVLHDRRLDEEARRVAAALPDDVLALGLASHAAGNVLELAEAVAEDPVGGFGSLDHDEQLLAARQKLRRLDRLGEHRLTLLQQQVCRPLVLAATLSVDGLMDEADAAVPEQLRSILRLGEHVDRGLRPAGDVAEMFAWQDMDFEEPAVAPPCHTATELFRPTRQVRPTPRVSLPPLCLGPPQPSAAMGAAWSRALRLFWRQGPVPAKWCPIDDEHGAGGSESDRESFVGLLDAIVTRCLADPTRAPIRWDPAAGRLGIGSVTLRPVRPQAYRIKQLFQHFEDHDWGTPLPRPLDPDAPAIDGILSPWNDETWKATRASLGKGAPVRHVRFESEGRQVAWRWDI